MLQCYVLGENSCFANNRKDLQYYMEGQRIHASNIRLFIRLPGCKTGLGFTRQVLYMLPGILLRWETLLHKLYTYKLKK